MVVYHIKNHLLQGKDYNFPQIIIIKHNKIYLILTADDTALIYSSLKLIS